MRSSNAFEINVKVLSRCPHMHASPLIPHMHASPLIPHMHASPLIPHMHASPLIPHMHASPLAIRRLVAHDLARVCCITAKRAH